MLIGGLQKVTLIDFPQKIACTIFTLGCSFRCPFCYSSELVLPEKIKVQPRISEENIFIFLEERKNFLEGVVICGGEPCIQKNLSEFIRKIKVLGFAVKLDTNGYQPKVLAHLIENHLIDYVAMDIKASKKKYNRFCGINSLDVTSKIEESMQILFKSNLPFEFRTTVAPGLTIKDIFEIADWLSLFGKTNYFLQKFDCRKEIIDSSILTYKLLTDDVLKDIIEKIRSKFMICKLR